jgi:hypothetical protein
MSVTRWTMVTILALAFSGGGFVLSAQQGRTGTGLGVYGLGPRLGENVQFALELRDQLGLSADQIASLNELQAGISRDVEPVAAEIANLRGRLMAGEVDGVSGIDQLQGLLAQYQAAADPYRIQVETILTPAQHEMLQTVMWNSRPAPGLGLYGAGMGPGIGLDYGLGWSQGAGLARPGGLGVGLARPRGLGVGLGRGLGRGAGRVLGRGMGRGRGLRWWR